MKKLPVLSAALAVFAVLAFSLPAGAINYGGVGGKPAYPNSGNPRTQSIFIYKLKPGQQTNDGVLLQNNTDQTQAIAVDAVDSELSSGGAFACKQAAEAKTGVGAWINLSATSATLPPNSTKVVPFVIAVPDSNKVAVGEHDGCITLQAASQTAKQSTKSGILLSFRSAIRVVVTIPGKIIKNLKITGIAVALAGGNYQVASTIRNTGNVSLDVSRQATLISIFGKTASTTSGGTTPVLPQTAVAWSTKLPRPFWGGLDKARVSVTYNSNPSTELGVKNAADSTTKSLDSATFVATPEPVAAAIEIGVLVIILAGIVWLIRKRRKSKRIKKQWKNFTLDDGDTLQSLAREFNTSWKTIAKVNKLKPPYDLHKGEKLKLPADKD